MFEREELLVRRQGSVESGECLLFQEDVVEGQDEETRGGRIAVGDELKGSEVLRRDLGNPGLERS